MISFVGIDGIWYRKSLKLMITFVGIDGIWMLLFLPMYNQFAHVFSKSCMIFACTCGGCMCLSVAFANYLLDCLQKRGVQCDSNRCTHLALAVYFPQKVFNLDTRTAHRKCNSLFYQCDRLSKNCSSACLFVYLSFDREEEIIKVVLRHIAHIWSR